MVRMGIVECQYGNPSRGLTSAAGQAALVGSTVIGAQSDTAEHLAQTLELDAGCHKRQHPDRGSATQMSLRPMFFKIDVMK